MSQTLLGGGWIGSGCKPSLVVFMIRYWAWRCLQFRIEGAEALCWCNQNLVFYDLCAGVQAAKAVLLLLLVS